jgi:chromosome segregation ATPase
MEYRLKDRLDMMKADLTRELEELISRRDRLLVNLKSFQSSLNECQNQILETQSAMVELDKLLEEKQWK